MHCIDYANGVTADNSQFMYIKQHLGYFALGQACTFIARILRQRAPLQTLLILIKSLYILEQALIH
jgi:hypothetical protein